MLITHLELFTSHLAEQKRFYTQDLGMALVASSRKGFTVQVGSSQLSFTQSILPARPVHVAFNIPFGQMDSCIVWLQNRGFHHLRLLPQPAWLSESAFISDVDGNYLEFIARQTVWARRYSKFEPADILQISEVGIACHDTLQLATTLRQRMAIGYFLRAVPKPEEVCLGLDSGLLKIRKAGTLWHSEGPEAQFAALGLHFSLNRPQGTSYRFETQITGEWNLMAHSPSESTD